MDHLEEIRARLSIEELVSSYIQLKKAGRSLKGLCPFHHEKTPSFVVSPDKGIAYCFGCNKGGDIFRFVELIENVDFKEAVKILAAKANVKIPVFNERQVGKRLGAIDINQKALAIFQENLRDNKKQQAYLKDRGLSEESITRFRIGYAEDDYHTLRDQLIKEGYTGEAILEAGLISQRSMADKTTFDRFRNRIMFPIFDHQGNPVGFGGRIVGEGEPKYLNSPDTPAYNKSLVLYALDQAKEAIKEKGVAIVCEGYMDVIMAHQAGTTNVVASSGTALTIQQVRLLKRFTGNIAFAFDQDQAGLEATRRAIDLTRESEVTIKVIVNPLGKDPADCVKEDPALWVKAAEHPVEAMEFYLQYAYRKHDQVTLAGQKEILQFILPLIKLHGTQFEQNHYVNRLAGDLKTDPKILWADLKKLKIPHRKLPTTDYGLRTTDSSPPPQPRIFSREEFLLGFLLGMPEKYAEITENLITNLGFDSATEKFYTACKKVYTASGSLDIDLLKTTLETEEERERCTIYQLLIEEHYPDFSEESAIKEALSLVREINRSNLQKVQKKVQFEIRETKGRDERLILLNQYNEILKLNAKLN
ncbi:DNA primase [Candidatus Peregrinibacteria bacterium]|nr:DNA primase [Candidatus Peregrinibacteria bacterium]